MRSLRIFIFWLLALWSPIVQPVTLLHFAESLAGGDLKETPTLGIEIEMIHSSRREIAGWMQQSLGGVLRTDGADEKLLGTDLGTLIFKYETNDLEDGITRGGSVIEIVTEPLSLAQIQKLDQALKLLKSKGVLGQTEGFCD